MEFNSLQYMQKPLVLYQQKTKFLFSTIKSALVAMNHAQKGKNSAKPFQFQQKGVQIREIKP